MRQHSREIPASMDDGQKQITPEILDAVRNGDDAVSRQLVDMLYPLVISIVRNHLPRSEAEEDLTQEVFMKIFSRMDQYSARQPFEHWVSRITLNTCYDRLRRQKSRRVMSYGEMGAEESDFLERALTGDPRPRREGGRELAFDLLERLFAALKPREQMVVRLLDLEEKSVAEVCELTGWGASRVRVTAMRGRRKLAATLQHLERTPKTPRPPES
ncbi:MAG: sigma-70 family RNA polymerase sigma factor [Akkermansiaceae bacterium]|nr:sigma-70 family RNA polymerase sigma factor [Akkermansiaceae bacterium]NNM30275.1 sigma-70 family RNA polymerase sigma factor [Akkermansiaceae bacterium]